MSNYIGLHGVFMNVFGTGVMITGPSGIGKSELALVLMSRSHQFIADDGIDLYKEGDALMGRCPETLQDFLEVRGLGIINVRKLFSDAALLPEKKLELIVHLEATHNIAFEQQDRIYGLYEEETILEVAIPKVTLPVAPGRNLSILLEAAVKNIALKKQGYEASEEFIGRHSEFLTQIRSEEE